MYAMFGFLYFNVFLMTAVIALLAVVQIYLQLQCGNHDWWWRIFAIGASGSIYVGLYSLYYMFFHLDVDLYGSDLIYLVYIYLFTTCFGMMCGSIAVGSAFLFLEVIYGKL